MKRIRLITALILCLALTLTSTGALAASQEATKTPTVKITAPSRAVRGGVGGELTVTPSAAGFLTLKLLSADGVELATICENQEVHTKSNAVEFDACDADGNPLAEGTYQVSATVVSQYGKVSKETTAKVKVGSPRPALSNVTVSASKAFNVSASYTATFDDTMASVEFLLYRTEPKATFFDEYDLIELTASASGSTGAINLTASNELPSAAGYYTLKGSISEYVTGISGVQIEVDFVVDADGSVYMLEDAPDDVLESVDEIVAEITEAIAAGTLEQLSAEAAASDEEEPADEEADEAGDSDETDEEEADEAEEDETDETEEKLVKETASAEKSSSSSASSSTKAASSTKTTSSGVSYGSGESSIGEEGYEIGVGVSDVAQQDDAGYWSLTSDSTDEEIWAAITRSMTTVDVAEQESAYIYNSPKDGRKQLGTVSGLSQGLNVIAERDDGWSLVEAYRNEDGAFVRGYIRTNKLRTVEPNTTYGLVVDKATQKLTVWKDGKAIGSCDVTTGLPTEKYLYRETPAGEYILVTRRGTIEYYGSNGYSKYTIRFSGNYHLCEIPTTKKNGSDFSLLQDSLGEKATRGHICLTHDASSDGGINAEWIWEMTTDNKKVKLLILDDKERDEVPIGE